ncbi:hypothetical protein NHE_0504 [Neorickettsia helminthoeca str. Oregon]|uniref:Uncharacterized protein n=1 Tax=Neorickettsia helminthoeca str. Oregon TaxID=1286528 RepID=X5H4F4_9RICK|nr:hypothetical protein [Neorickettsia helminthoeca]AHX11446.1 hypothetical protein NHE_0504 [Neorickettsia helminthoeca str. Oregon]
MANTERPVQLDNTDSYVGAHRIPNNVQYPAPYVYQEQHPRSFVGTITGGIKSGSAWIANTISTLPTTLLGAAQNTGSVLINAVGALKSGLTSVASAVSTIPSTVQNAESNLVNTVVGIGHTVESSGVRIIRDALSTQLNEASTLFNTGERVLESVGKAAEGVEKAANDITEAADLMQELVTGVNRWVRAIADTFVSLRTALRLHESEKIVAALELIVQHATKLEHSCQVSCLIESTYSDTEATTRLELICVMIARASTRLDEARSPGVDFSSDRWKPDVLLKEFRFRDITESLRCCGNAKKVIQSMSSLLPEFRKACSSAASSANNISGISDNVKFWILLAALHTAPIVVFVSRSAITSPSYSASMAFIIFQAIAATTMLLVAAKSASEVIKYRKEKNTGNVTASLNKTSLELLVAGSLSLPFTIALLGFYIIGIKVDATLQSSLMKGISVCFVCSIVTGIALPILYKLYADGYFRGSYVPESKNSAAATKPEQVEGCWHTSINDSSFVPGLVAGASI